MQAAKFSMAALLLSATTLFSSAQNVGIGTSNPTESRLVVVESVNPLIMTLKNEQALTIGLKTGMAFKRGSFFTGGIFTTGTSNNAARLGLYTFADADLAGLRERFVIDDNGYVGINDTTPQVLLSINGDGYATSPTNRRVVRVNNATMVLNGNVGQPALRTNGDAVFSDSYLHVDETSRLGIGIVPAYPLDVQLGVGEMRIRDGNEAAGRVLTSDANGIATWASLPGKSAKGVLGTTRVLNTGSAAGLALSFNANGGFTDLVGGAPAATFITIGQGQGGTYMLSAQVTWQVAGSFAGTKYFRFAIRKNATDAAVVTMLTSYDNVDDTRRTQATTVVVKLAAGDTVSLNASQESGATQNILAGESLTFLTATKLY
jgi:hypothetical protein